MPKCIFVGQKEWPVANTKTKKEKTKKAPKIGNFSKFRKTKKCVFIPASLDPTCRELHS